MLIRFGGPFTLAAVLVGSSAEAHLALVEPVSRYGASVLKTGPCGLANGSRTENVTRYAPGQTILVQWDEYIDHPGHYRIAFDSEGDDDFVDPICTADCTTRQPRFDFYTDPTILLDNIPDTQGGVGRAEVTLPTLECSRCTLQVIQVMYDKPPYTTPGNDIYYQCADLELTSSTLPDAGGSTSDGGTVVDAEVGQTEDGGDGADAPFNTDGERVDSGIEDGGGGGCACSTAVRGGPDSFLAVFGILAALAGLRPRRTLPRPR